MAKRILVVQHQDDCPPAMVGDWLTEAGCWLDVRRPDAGEPLPVDLAAHDGLLVLGGSMGAHDVAEHPWLVETKQLVREAARRDVPTLGICLGHQLVAVALGGRVSPNSRGQQLGLLPVGWTGQACRDDLMGDLVGTPVGVQWNDDLVTDLPTGTVVLAHTEHGELQAARFAPTVWGVQLHPEVDETILRAWAEEEPARHAEGVVEDVLRRVAAAREDLVDGWRPLAESFARLLGSAR